MRKDELSMSAAASAPQVAVSPPQVAVSPPQVAVSPPPAAAGAPKVARVAADSGVLGAEGRARLSRARVLVVGSGGIGGTVAHELARSGIGSIAVVDFDAYADSNLNRQVACYADTLGRPKAEVLAAEIARMGLGCEARAIVERRRADGFAREIAEADLVIAAADDYAFSLALMDRALEAGKPCGAALPVGLWAATSLFLPGGPAPASLFGFRVRPDEEGYAEEIRRRRRAIARHMRRRSGGPWTPELEAFAKGEGRPPQACPVVWAAASLLVLEALRFLSGVGRPLVAPRYAELGGDGARARLSLPALFGARAKGGR